MPIQTSKALTVAFLPFSSLEKVLTNSYLNLFNCFTDIDGTSPQITDKIQHFKKPSSGNHILSYCFHTKLAYQFVHQFYFQILKNKKN